MEGPWVFGKKTPLSEDHMTEFKHPKRGKLPNIHPLWNRLAKVLNAFLNTKGGTVYIGVQDNGTIRGLKLDALKDEDRVRLRVDNIVNNFKPQIDARHFHVEFLPVARTERRSSIVKISLQKGVEPLYTYNGRAWQRMSASNCQMTREMMNSRRNRRVSTLVSKPPTSEPILNSSRSPPISHSDPLHSNPLHSNLLHSNSPRKVEKKQDLQADPKPKQHPSSGPLLRVICSNPEDEKPHSRVSTPVSKPPTSEPIFNSSREPSISHPSPLHSKPLHSNPLLSNPLHSNSPRKEKKKQGLQSDLKPKQHPSSGPLLQVILTRSNPEDAKPHSLSHSVSPRVSTLVVAVILLLLPISSYFIPFFASHESVVLLDESTSDAQFSSHHVLGILPPQHSLTSMHARITLSGADISNVGLCAFTFTQDSTSPKSVLEAMQWSLLSPCHVRDSPSWVGTSQSTALPLLLLEFPSLLEGVISPPQGSGVVFVLENRNLLSNSSVGYSLTICTHSPWRSSLSLITSSIITLFAEFWMISTHLFAWKNSAARLENWKIKSNPQIIWCSSSSSSGSAYNSPASKLRCKNFEGAVEDNLSSKLWSSLTKGGETSLNPSH